MSALLMVVAAATLAAPQGKDDPLAPRGASGGRIIFRTLCATCHGRDARGFGPLADSLKTPPADLTLIADRNGGTFPARWVAERIDGREYVEQHGPSEMPVWAEGIAYLVSDEGLREERIHRAIDMVVRYLATIQK